MRPPSILSVVSSFLALAMTAPSLAETVKDREGAVRGDRARMEQDARWIYNDVDRGFAEAQKSRKPLLVVLRCVPCMSCMGIDASILNSSDLQPVLDQFVCVRVINANTLDLSLFQFDYDLSFSTLFFNADKTLYGRYGSWQHQRDANDATTAGYKAALAAVLAIHKGYPANKPALAAKQGGPAPFKVPVEIPALAEKYGRELNWDGKVVQSCVHCHQIGDAFRSFYRNQGKAIPEDLIYPMPAPETVGMTLDAQFVARVKAIQPGSAAAAAGLRLGDDLLSAQGQALVSIADFAWVLHRAPASGRVDLQVRGSDGATRQVALDLAPGWRQRADISTRVGTWPMRAMATGGLSMVELDDAERAKWKISETDMALFIKGVGQYGPHGAAKKAGFQKGDILISIDGSTRRRTESEWIGEALTKYTAKKPVKATVLRDGKSIDLMLPIQ